MNASISESWDIVPTSPQNHPRSLNHQSPLRSHTAAYMNTRSRAKSFGSEPLLMPRSPPTGLRSLSLSPSKIDLDPATEERLGAPSFVNVSEPPRVSESQRAVEHALQQERKRVKTMEPGESTLSANELRVVLKKERQRMFKFAADLARLKIAAVQCQAESEIHEERCINGLVRRLESLQLEKTRIIIELEREEEMLTNTLQKKLSQVRSEKADLEKLIEKEHAEHEVMEQKLVTLQEKVDNPEIKEPSSIETAVRKTRFTNSLPGMTEMPDDEGEEVNDEMWDDDLGRPVFR